MVIDNPIILVPIFLGLLLGMGFCLYVLYRIFSGSGKKRSPGKGSPAGASRAAKAVAKPAARPDRGPATRKAQQMLMPATTELPKDAIEIFRVLRIGSMGELVVEVDGRLYQKITQIRDGTTGRRVLLAIQELGGFTGPHASDALPELHRMGAGTQAPGAASRLTEEQQAFLDGLGQAGSSTPESTGQDMNLVGFWRQGFSRSGRKTTSAAPDKSFVVELEELLQARLASRPELDLQSIHFRSTPAGDLRIEVDGGLYEAVDDVPYPEVVSLLKSVIRSWERS